MKVTEGELLDAAERYAHSVIDRKEFITIAEQWAKSLNDGKPIVGRSAANAEKKYKCSACGKIVWLAADEVDKITYCENAKSEAQFILQE